MTPSRSSGDNPDTKRPQKNLLLGEPSPRREPNHRRHCHSILDRSENCTLNIPAELMFHPDLRVPPEILVFWLFMMLDDPQHGCYASNETIAAKLGISVRAVQKARRWLNEKGYIQSKFDRSKGKRGRMIDRVNVEGVMAYEGFVNNWLNGNAMLRRKDGRDGQQGE